MDPEAPSPRAGLPRSALAAAVSSGAAGLAFELVWVRQLALAMGSTAPALAWVFSAFFAGLTAGALVGARLRWDADRARVAYGCIEFMIASAGLGAGMLFPWASRSSAAWVDALPVLLLPATFAMGLTLPVLCAATGAGPRGASLLYVVNTVGGALGAAAAGFATFEFLGIGATLGLASLCNALAAAFVWLGVPEDGPDVRERADAPPNAFRRSAGVSAVAFGIGFVALAGEVVLNRLLYQVLGGTTYAVTTTLCVYLLAMATGSALTARRRVFEGERSWLLPSTIFGFGVATAASPGVLALTAGALRTLVRATELGTALGFAASLAAAIVVLTPAALASGLAFPLLVRRAGRGGGEALGTVYGVNTLGAIAGSLVTTFVLVPRFGTTVTLAVLGGGAAALATFAGAPRARPALLGGALVLTVLGIWFAPAPAGFRLWLYGDLDPSSAEGNLDAVAAGRTDEVEVPLVYVEGVSASAGVYERRRPGRVVALDFAINGKKEASTDFEALRNQRVLGHLPMLLHPEPRRVLVVGLGAGVTAGAAAVHAGAEVTVAELAPEVPRATREFAGPNRGVLDRPNVKLVFRDGRRVLVDTAAAKEPGQRFDVVTSDPIHPWVAGAVNLYTREYFELVAASLAPGGVAAHWLPLYEMDFEDALAVFRSFHAALPHAALWVTFAGDAVLVGSVEPLHVDLHRFASRAAAAPVREDLEEVRLGDPLRLLAGLAVGSEALDRRPGKILTDNRQALEFRAARAVFRSSTVGPNLTALAGLTWDWTRFLEFLGIVETPGQVRLASLLEANRSMMRAVGAIREHRSDAAALAVAAWAREPDGELLAPLLLAPGLDGLLAEPRTAAEALFSGSAAARRARRERAAAELPEALSRALLTLEAAFALPGLDAGVDRALRRQIAVLRGELREYRAGLAVLEPLLDEEQPDPTILRIAARLLVKLDRAAEAEACVKRAAALDYRP